MHMPAQAQTSAAHAYATRTRCRALAELAQFVAIPSVSSERVHGADVARAARWLAGRLRAAGLPEVALVPVPGPPLVVGAWRRRPGAPTVLIYGHYDVQPAGPSTAWRSPPFQPTVRNGALYGRGASDDKGQLYTHVKALEAYLQGAGELPCNVVCLFEGEEEIGSPHLRPALRLINKLRPDLAVVSDTRMLAPGRPALTYALRGKLVLHVTVQGPGHALHAGAFGGAVHNPLHALCDLLAGLHDARGHLRIPDFYREVLQVPPAERAALAKSGPSDAVLRHDAEIEQGWGEPGYSLYERTALLPSLSITSMGGGVGEGDSIPARATARLVFRLVPDQEPEPIAQRVIGYLRQQTPPTVRLQVRLGQHTRPVLLPRDHPALRAAAQAYQAGFGVPPVLLRSGGTIPVVSMLQSEMGIPTVLMGYALPGDAMHGPNEKMDLNNFYRGIATNIAFLAVLPSLKPYRLPGAPIPPHLAARSTRR